MNSQAFTAEQIAQLHTAFGSLPSFPVSFLPRVHKMFAPMSDEMIEAIAKAKVKFISGLAVNEQRRRRQSAGKAVAA